MLDYKSFNLPNNQIVAGVGIGGLHYSLRVNNRKCEISKKPDNQTFPTVVHEILNAFSKIPRENRKDHKISIVISVPSPPVSGQHGSFYFKLPGFVKNGRSNVEDEKIDLRNYFVNLLQATAKLRKLDINLDNVLLEFKHDAEATLEWMIDNAKNSKNGQLKNKKVVLILNGSGYNIGAGITNEKGNLKNYANTEDGLVVLDRHERDCLSPLFHLNPLTENLAGGWHNSIYPQVYNFVSGGTDMTKVSSDDIEKMELHSEYGFKIYWKRLYAAALRYDEPACRVLGLTGEDVFKCSLFKLGPFVSNQAILAAVKHRDKAAIAITKKVSEHLGKRLNRYLHRRMRKENRTSTNNKIQRALRVQSFIPDFIFASGKVSKIMFSFPFARKAFFNQLKVLRKNERMILEKRLMIEEPPQDGAFFLALRTALRTWHNIN